MDIESCGQIDYCMVEPPYGLLQMARISLTYAVSMDLAEALVLGWDRKELGYLGCVISVQ